MNNIRITQYVDDVFKDVKMTAMALEQKEELIVNITERVQDSMREGASFDEAFDAVKSNMGDLSELTARFEKIPAVQTAPSQTRETSAAAAPPLRSSFGGLQLAAVSPFVFVLLGLAFGWWAWAWVIIPISGVLCAPISLGMKITGIAPFVYVLLGLAFGWWAWAWVIIPVLGILTARVRH